MFLQYVGVRRKPCYSGRNSVPAKSKGNRMSRRIIIALLTMFFFAGFMAPVSAAPEASDLAAAAVAQAQQKGYATAAQRAIILSEPEVARTTADPAATQVQVKALLRKFRVKASM